MNLFHSIQARGSARKLVSGNELTEAEAAALEQQLLGFGSAAIRPLLESLPPGPVNARALEVLERLLTNASLSEYVEGVRSARASTSDAAVAALERSHTYDPTQLLPLLADATFPRAKLEGILAARSDALPAGTLVQLLVDLPRDTRSVAMRLLERRVDPGIVHDLAKISTHEDHWVRLQAIKLMTRIDHPVAVDTAIRLLRDPHPSIRLEAIGCLAARGTARAIPALCERLRDENLSVQGAAIQTLIDLNDVSAVTALLEYLKDDSEYVRRAAVEVLNRVVTVEAIKDLVNALRDADWWVRVRAADALGTLGGDRVVEAVMGLLDDTDSFARRYAVEILNTVPDARAVEPLIRALADEDWWVRERAIDALAKTADPRAVPPLLAMLDREPRAAPMILKALGAIGDPRGVDAACRRASSESPEVRAAAIEALEAFARCDAPDAVHAAREALRGAGGPAHSAAPIRVRPATDPEAGRAASQPAVTPASGRADATRARPVLDTEHLMPETMLGDRYRIVRHIGGGGFGTVYLAEDTFVNEQVALKLLAPHLCRDELMLRRFVEELKLTRRITHRNVIRIHEFLDLDGVRAISMEFLDGRDLGQIIAEERRLDAMRVLDIADQVVQGLAAAHEMGIIHRDIKPANLLVASDGTVKIVDFGLAAVTQHTGERLTQAGTIIGTPEFIAPELIDGGVVDARADLYALGCVLYFALSGREPFSGENAVRTLYRHLEGDAPGLDTVCPDIPREVRVLVERAMARQPADRPASATEMLAAIRPLRRAA